MITAIFRTVILYALLVTGFRLTGKRQVGQLEPIELVLAMTLSDLAAVPMQDFGIPLLYGVVPIVTMLSLSTLLSYLSMRSVRFRSLLCGESAIIIRQGKVRQDVMRHNRLTIDELLEELRKQGIGDISAVKYAVLETDGQLSVLPYDDENEKVFLPTVLINDGRLLHANLQRTGYDDKWLYKQLYTHHLHRTEDVFMLLLNDDGSVVLIPKEAVS